MVSIGEFIALSIACLFIVVGLVLGVYRFYLIYPFIREIIMNKRR